MYKAQLNKLFETVKAFDGAEPKLYWPLLAQARSSPWDFYGVDQDQLVVFIAAYAFEIDTIEITYLIHPDYRDQPFLSHFLNKIKAHCPHIKQYRFACSASEASQKQMKSLGAKWEYSEWALYWQDKPSDWFENLSGELKPATQSTLAALVSLDVACFDSNPMQIKPQFEKWLLDKNREIDLFYWEGAPIGKIHIRFSDPASDSASVYFHDLCISPQYQGKGYGAKMLLHALKQITQKGYRDIRIEVLESNQHALNLYQKVGFEKVNRYDYYAVRA